MPIDLDLYLTFVAATVVLIAMPGPMVSLVVANSLSQGTRAGLVTVAGGITALLGQLAVTVLGMGSVLGLLAHWFEWVRWAGVAYLLYLGVAAWRAPLGTAAVPAAPRASRALYAQGFVVNATNPKALVFYAAFFPQFLSPALPALPQLLALSVTFFLIATTLDSSYALVAGKARHWLRSERLQRWRNRVTGSLLIGAGLGLALARRSQ